MALGLFSVLLAAFSLWRQDDVKRFFAFSTIEQSGIAAFAFGLGGTGAIFAGLLHMTLHTLLKSAIFQCVGRAAQLKGGQTFADIGGLFAGHRQLALALAASIVALASIPLAIGLVTGAWALILRLQTLCLGAPTPDRGPAPAAFALAPAWLHLALVLVFGLAMPGAMVAWLQTIAVSAQ